MKIIEKSIKSLLDNNPFYAHFFLSSKIVYDDPKVPTAAATISETGCTLYFNTEWLNQYSTEEVCGVVEHEVLHLLFDHVSEMKKKSTKYPQIANIAMDAAINQWIKVLPPETISLDMLNKGLNLKLAPLETWEYYYNHLVKKGEEEMSKYSTLDDHSSKAEESTNNALAKPVLREIMDKAIKQAKGNVPQHIMKVFDAFSSDAKLPWQQILSNFVAKSIKTTTKPTRKRPNRRFGIDQPGRNKKRELTLGVCVDTSGSISDEQYKSFMNEVHRIAKTCGTTYIIDADCTVQNVQKVDKKKKVNNNRHGAGGTAYQPAIDECTKLKCDAIVYCGDADSADTPTNPGVPFLWVLVGKQEPPGSFGGVVRL